MPATQILFQVKVFGEKIKKTTLANYFTKVTARPTFTWLRVIKQVKRVYEIFKWKICCKHSVVSLSYLNLLGSSNVKYNSFEKNWLGNDAKALRI